MAKTPIKAKDAENEKTPEKPTEGGAEVTNLTKKKPIHVSYLDLMKLKQIQEKANDKDYGSKISIPDIISEVLNNVNTDKIVKKLQEESLTPEDKVRSVYQKYCKANEEIEFDSFVLKVLTKEITVDVDLKVLCRGGK